MEEIDAATKKLVRGLHDHFSRLSIQVECPRLLQQIEADLRELRAHALEARIAKPGDIGYIPEQAIEDDRVCHSIKCGAARLMNACVKPYLL